MKTLRSANRFHGVSTAILAFALLSLSACSIVPKSAQFAGTKLTSEKALSLSSLFSNKTDKSTRYATKFLPTGQTIMAPMAFLEMCERAPEDCDYSGHADRTVLVDNARSAILAKLDRAFSGNPLDQEMATAAIKVTSPLPAPIPNQMVISYLPPQPSDYAGRDNDTPHVLPAYSEDLSGSDLTVAATSIEDQSDTPSASVVPTPALLASVVVNSSVASSTEDKSPDPSPIRGQGPADYLRINFDPQIKSLVQKINNLVNQTIVPDDDVRIYQSSDFWNAPGMAPGTRGDCEDYALEKRRLLVESGIPADALSLAIVKTSNDVEHVVLILSTTQGDLVLDNLHYNIKDWRKAGYTWISRQGTGDDLSWISLKDANTLSEMSPADSMVAINQ